MAKRKLGRDLTALLSGSPSPSDTADVAQIPVAAIEPNPFQPRRDFDPDAMETLVHSIQQHGLLQPIVVRPHGTGYQLIAGERRWRAASTVQLDTVPALIKSISDQEASALALIENIQREDLGVLEEVDGLARLRDEFGLSQQAIADIVGRSRAAVANLLRLQQLSEHAKTLLAQRLIEMGHARALLPLSSDQQDLVAQQVVDQGLSVRAVESLANRIQHPQPVKPPKTKPSLSDRQRQSVVISNINDQRTDVTISCTSPEELKAVLQLLGIRPNGEDSTTTVQQDQGASPH
ncbi:MAG: ParB/RepB/Spo0J family partition protein [Thalassospira sp.]|uniref:ParB/RepB/Spo0J family partition protein n=1 Tax=Thalassospira sp. TaxID=1912094 RepID=UPI003A85D180